LSAGGNCCNQVSACAIAASAGNDVQFCTGGSVTLNGTATGGATVYSWSPTTGLSNPNSASTVAAPTVTTTYVLTAGDGANCADADTIVVTVNPLPLVNLGPDTMLCGGTILLNAGAQPNSTFLWSDNSTAQTLNAGNTGSYSVTVTNTNTGCSNSDAINVFVNAPPVVTLGNDTAICGDVLVLDAGVHPNSTYLWSNSGTQQTTTVFISGTYSVVVTDANGCTASDAMTVTFNQIPVVNFTAAMPVVCLSDQQFALTTGSPAGGTYTGTGVTAGNFDPQAAGIGSHLITYTYTDSMGCTSSASDSVMVDACLNTGGVSAFGAKLFPNPSDGTFQLYVAQSCTAELVNSLGQTVEIKALLQGNNTLGNSELAEGMYTLQLTNGTQQQIMRVMIQR
jgi:hypothetical protein